jgi:hypothetical protein
LKEKGRAFVAFANQHQPGNREGMDLILQALHGGKAARLAFLPDDDRKLRDYRIISQFLFKLVFP